MTIAINDALSERVRSLAQKRGMSEQQLVEEALRWYLGAVERGFTATERAEFEALEKAADEDFDRLSQEHDWSWQA
jgi:predicted transcriptional regulator